MQYAVIRSGGKQFRVSPGDVIDVDYLTHDGKTVSFTDVLLVSLDSTLLVGNPLVAGALVKGKVIGDRKGRKLSVAKYKSKVRYRRVHGFRSRLSRVQIEEIRTAGDAAIIPRKEEKIVKKPTRTVRKRTRTVTKIPAS